MFKLPFARRGKRALIATLTAALVGTAGLAVAAPSASAVSGTTGPVSVTISPTTGLVDGQSISVSGTLASPGFFRIRAHVCVPGTGAALTPTDTYDFGFQGSFCSKTAPGAGDFEKSQGYDGSVTSSSLTFKAGTTSNAGVNWADENDGTVHNLKCNAANPCELVVEFQTVQSGGAFYFSTPLTFAGQPGAPTLNTATAGDQSVALAWTAPANTGNGTIDQYTVNYTDTVTSTTGTFTVNGPAPATNTNVPSLTNFHAYTFTVKARNVAADGTTHFPSVDSNQLSATPGPAGPTGVSGTPADSAVNLAWNPPANTSGLDNYRITVYIGGVAQGGLGGLISLTTSTATNFTVGGLANGTVYTFTVAARYGGSSFGAESAPSSPVTPQGKFITQHITVTRPQGDLVLTQVCGGPTDLSVPAYDPTVGLYPTDCTVSLGTAKLITTGAQAGQYFSASGAIRAVTVVDTRDTDPGWNVNASVSNFTAGIKSFSGNDLGWSPIVTDHSLPFTSPDGPYTQDVTAGAVVDPGSPGLGSSRTLASGAIGGVVANHGGLGIAHLDGTLNLLIPVFAKSGTYTAVMTITAV